MLGSEPSPQAPRKPFSSVPRELGVAAVGRWDSCGLGGGGGDVVGGGGLGGRAARQEVY